MVKLLHCNCRAFYIVMVKLLHCNSRAFTLDCDYRAGGSMDTQMSRLHLHVDTPCTKSAKKSVFGSIERSMDKLLCMLTPKRKPSSPDKPRIVKVLIYLC